MKKILFLLLMPFMALAQVPLPKSTTTFSNINATGNLTVTGTAKVTGASTLTGAVTTGTNLSVGGSGTFTGSITSPTVYGGSTASSTLNLMSTSSATPGVINMGAGSGTVNINNRTNITNSLTIGSGVTTNTTALGVLRIGQGTSWLDLGERSAGLFGLWFGQNPNTTTNYGVLGNVNDTYVNAASTLYLATAGTVRATIVAATTSFSNNVSSTGNISSSSKTSGIGYAVGSGSTVTQASSRTTGVTINAITGSITLVSAAGSASFQTFTVSNTGVAANDVVIINQKSGTDLNEIHITAVAAGSFNVTFRTTGGTTVEQPVFNFAVIKGQTN